MKRVTAARHQVADVYALELSAEITARFSAGAAREASREGRRPAFGAARLTPPPSATTYSGVISTLTRPIRPRAEDQIWRALPDDAGVRTAPASVV